MIWPWQRKRSISVFCTSTSSVDDAKPSWPHPNLSWMAPHTRQRLPKAAHFQHFSRDPRHASTANGKLSAHPSGGGASQWTEASASFRLHQKTAQQRAPSLHHQNKQAQFAFWGAVAWWNRHLSKSHRPPARSQALSLVPQHVLLPSKSL
jgi:hypothetical protein